MHLCIYASMYLCIYVLQAMLYDLQSGLAHTASTSIFFSYLRNAVLMIISCQWYLLSYESFVIVYYDPMGFPEVTKSHQSVTGEVNISSIIVNLGSFNTYPEMQLFWWPIFDVGHQVWFRRVVNVDGQDIKAGQFENFVDWPRSWAQYHHVYLLSSEAHR